MTKDKTSSTQVSSEHAIFVSLLRKSIVAALVGVPLFIWSFIGSSEVTTGIDQLVWIGIGLIALFVLWYSGGHFFSGAWASLKAHRANMYTLIAVATGPAWLYSFIVSLWPSIFPIAAREKHYEAPLTIIALIVFGAAFEMRASAKASERSKYLSSLVPKNARVTKNNNAQEVPIDTVSIGDVVDIQPNEIISVDGEIIEGQSTIDESIFSNERVAVEKQIGNDVFAGTMNKTAHLKVKVTETSKDIALSKVIDMLKQAQNARPSIGTIADKIAGIFAPLVLIIALFTPLIWYNFGPAPQIAYMLTTFMAVLLIACPCALGLATPISITAGTSKASVFGIIFREKDAMETTSHLTTLLIDESVLPADTSSNDRAVISPQFTV